MNAGATWVILISGRGQECGNEISRLSSKTYIGGHLGVEKSKSLKKCWSGLLNRNSLDKKRPNFAVRAKQRKQIV